MGITLEKLLGKSLNEGKIGISLDDLLNTRTLEEIDCKTYLDYKTDWIDINNCYIIDSETNHLNSKLKCIQCYNTELQIVYFFYTGIIEEIVGNQVIQEIKKYGINIELIYCKDEMEIVEKLLTIIYENPKTLVGHNLAHFDLGLIHCKMQKYDLVKDYKIYLKGWKTGSGDKERFAYFTYLHNFNDDKQGKRFRITDTMLMAQTLFIPSSLKELSKESQSKFPKKEINYKEFENEILSYEAILYSIFDVLSLIDVYNYIFSIIDEISQKYLKIERKATQQCYEHLWMKGAGSLAEAFLKKFLGRINPNVPDFLTKYYGGLCRVWNFDLIRTNEKQEEKQKSQIHKLEPKNFRFRKKNFRFRKKTKKYIMRELDFTSAYPFAILLQGIFDILNGDYEYFENSPIKYNSEIYRKLIYSSTLVLKVKKPIDLIFECDMSKNSGMIGIGYLRSFDNQKKVSELEHTLGILRCEVKSSPLPETKVFIENNISLEVRERLDLEVSEKVILTKTELEMNLLLNPNLFDYVELLYVKDGLIATSNKKSLEYIQLFKERMKLKKEENKAEYGIKVIFNSQYGKLAQSVSDFFNLCCASAITGFQRFQIFATCLFALKKGVKSLSYSDTDSLYTKTTMEIMKQIIEYAETLNPYPMKLFGVNNLKMESDRIICFHPIKRKRYLKIYYNKKNELVIKIKGENGNSDFRWRDIFFRLSLICKGKTTIKEIQECILKRDFALQLPIYKGKDEKGEEKTEFRYLDLFEEIYSKYKEEEVTKIIPELDSKAKVTMMYNVHFKTSINYENGIYYDKIRKCWENETNEKAYVGCFFAINREINTKIEEITLLEDCEQGKKGETITIKKHFSTFEPKDKKAFDYQINLESYESHFDIIPILLNKTYNQILLRRINLDTLVLKTSHPLPLWLLTEEKAKKVTYNSFNSPHNGKRYNSHLSNPSLFVKLRIKSINTNLKTLEEINDVRKKKIDWESDRELYERYFPYLDFVKIDSSKETFKDVKGKTKKKKIYVNTHLFIQNVVRFESICRVNKFRLFCENSNVFNVYKTISRLSNLMQVTVERLFELRGIKIDTPRFLFSTQLDICQITTKEFHKALYMKSYDSPFELTVKNHFEMLDFCKYLSLTCYNKQKSALNKIRYYEMLENEKKYFQEESKEGYRSEIKFRLQRNFYESLSYAYMLNLINHNYFLQFIENANKIKKMKNPNFQFSSYFAGKFKFTTKQVILLFKAFDFYDCDLIEYLKNRTHFPNQEGSNENLNTKLNFSPMAIEKSSPEIKNLDKYLIQEYIANPLEGRGLYSPPPKHSQNVSNTKIEYWKKRYREKSNKISKSLINWGINKNDFDFELGKNEEVLFSELFSRF